MVDSAMANAGTVMGADEATTTARRQRFAKVLAKAACDDVKAAWDQFAGKPAMSILRPPETGLVMARGRIGGGGGPFNLGEVTVTRCSVQVDGGQLGHGYVLGRNEDLAVIVATADALAQAPDDNGLERAVIVPLEEKRKADLATLHAETAATKVDFFTMVRGEDE